MKIVFHAHSESSKDCELSIDTITAKLRDKGIAGLVLTDHNRLTYKKMTKLNGVTIIPAEEIATKEGEIIGMFLKKEIATGLSFSKALHEIHKQGGLAIVPHPCDRFRTKVVSPEALIKNIHEIDVVETFNSRTVFPVDDRLALKLARQYHKPVIHGADAHLLTEYGPNFIANTSISSPRQFLNSLKTAKFTSRKAPLWVHLETKYVKWKKKLLN